MPDSRCSLVPIGCSGKAGNGRRVCFQPERGQHQVVGRSIPLRLSPSLWRQRIRARRSAGVGRARPSGMLRQVGVETLAENDAMKPSITKDDRIQMVTGREDRYETPPHQTMAANRCSFRWRGVFGAILQRYRHLLKHNAHVQETERSFEPFGRKANLTLGATANPAGTDENSLIG